MADDCCPLCMEELDSTDKNFTACQCGYQVCLWCWHNIKNEYNGLCPACRNPYTKEAKQKQNIDREDVVRRSKQKKHKERQDRRAAAAAASQSINRRTLTNVRVMQRNLVYVIGLPVKFASEERLRKLECFGQYGKIIKIVVNKSHLHSDRGNATASAYITFAEKGDASNCIQAIDGYTLCGKVLRASFGTTKYCNFFLRNMTCSNPECLYLHDFGERDDSFTKDEMQSGKGAFRDVMASCTQPSSNYRCGNSFPQRLATSPSSSAHSSESKTESIPHEEEDEAPTQVQSQRQVQSSLAVQGLRCLEKEKETVEKKEEEKINISAVEALNHSPTSTNEVPGLYHENCSDSNSTPPTTGQIWNNSFCHPENINVPTHTICQNGNSAYLASPLLQTTPNAFDFDFPKTSSGVQVEDTSMCGWGAYNTSHSGNSTQPLVDNDDLKFKSSSFVRTSSSSSFASVDANFDRISEPTETIANLLGLQLSHALTVNTSSNAAVSSNINSSRRASTTPSKSSRFAFANQSAQSPPNHNQQTINGNNASYDSTNVAFSSFSSNFKSIGPNCHATDVRSINNLNNSTSSQPRSGSSTSNSGNLSGLAFLQQMLPNVNISYGEKNTHVQDESRNYSSNLQKIHKSAPSSGINNDSIDFKGKKAWGSTEQHGESSIARDNFNDPAIINQCSSFNEFSYGSKAQNNC